MLIPQNSLIYDWVVTLYPELKFWVFVGGGLWGIFKIVQWFKDLKSNHLHHLQLSMDEIGKDIKEVGPEVSKAVDSQTLVVVDSFNALREDVRMLTAAMLSNQGRDVNIQVK